MEKAPRDPELPAELSELILVSESRFQELIGQKYWQSDQKHVFSYWFNKSLWSPRRHCSGLCFSVEGGSERPDSAVERGHVGGKPVGAHTAGAARPSSSPSGMVLCPTRRGPVVVHTDARPLTPLDLDTPVCGPVPPPRRQPSGAGAPSFRCLHGAQEGAMACGRDASSRRVFADGIEGSESQMTLNVKSPVDRRGTG